MAMPTTVSAEPITASGRKAVRAQVRGSSLLLAGRFLSKGVNFLSQIVIVRYLSQSDYGALAYALSIVTLGQAVATFGLDRAVTRFIPIYHEEKQYGKMFGTLLMVLGTVFSIGLGMAFLLYACQGIIPRFWISDQQVLTLLLVLIFLAPVHAIDELFVGLFAVFASPGAIFFRKHVLGPSLKLAVVLLLVLVGGDVLFVAAGYLVANILGVCVCAAMLWKTVRKQDLLEHFDVHAVVVPWREVLAFTIPLLTSDLVYVVMHTMDVIVLERFASVEQVGALRAVQPAAMLNQLVLASFATLFMPAAARMFARRDRQGINDLYWQTAIWISVLTFPVFAVTFSLAQPATELLFGARYAGSGPILAILSLGCYFHAALGFNGLTLKVYGKLRYIVAINVAACVLNLIVILLLIPRYGALGAAIGTCFTLCIHNVFKQAGLRMGTGISLFDPRYFGAYLSIVLSALGLWLVQWTVSPPPALGLLLAALMSLLVFRWNRHLLSAGETFPELLRLPLMRQILGQ